MKVVALTWLKPPVGSLIAVYGTISPASLGRADPTTRYTLDSTTALSYHAQSTNDTQYKVLFYQSQPLSNETHTLEIVIQSAGHFWLDYMVITSDFSLSPGESSATVSGTNTQTIIQNQTPFPTPDPSTTGSSARSQPTRSSSAGIIAVGVMAGVLALILIFLLIWYLRRIMSRKHSDKHQTTLPYTSFYPFQPPASQSSGPQSVVPFILSSPASSQNMFLSHNHSGLKGTGVSQSTRRPGMPCDMDRSKQAGHPSLSIQTRSNKILPSQPRHDPPPAYSGSYT